MMPRLGIFSIVVGLLLSGNVVLADHSPTAWTRGHYSGSEVSADDVVAYWAFEEPEKDGLVVAEDGSPRGNVLIEHPMNPDRVGVVRLGPGKSGEAFFSATATSKDRACRSMSQDFNLKHAFTVEMWFKLDPGLWAKAQGHNLTLFCQDDNCQGGQARSAMGHLVQLPDAPPNTFSLEFLRRVDDKPRSEHRQMVSRHKVVLPGGTWHHVAFTWDGEKARTYLDGKLLSEVKQTTGALLDSAEIWVGSHFWMSGFLGSIDSVRVLDRAIAFAEAGKQPTVLPRPIRNAAAAATVKKSEKRTKKRVWVGDGASFQEKLALRFVKPHYRDSIYAGQELDHVVAEVHSALPHRVELSFGPAGGEPTFTRRIESALDPVTVRMPAKDLAEGKHEFTARLLTGGDDAAFSKTLTLRKLPVHPHTVRLREDGIWLRRGKPYMPVGYFGLQVRGSAPTIAELVRTQGINAGLTYHRKRGDDPNIQRLLDEAAKHDVSILIYPWSDKGGLEPKAARMSEAVRTEVSEKVNLFKDHPGLLGWYMADEPELLGVTPSWLREMYGLIRELDPYHPCVVLNDTLPGVARYAETADISMPDPYIVPLKVGPPKLAMTKIAAFMDAVRNTGKPAWITPEAFNYASHTEAKSMARAANYTEQRCIAFLAMVHGARGYVYYMMAHCLPEPELRIGMVHVMRELTFVSQMLTAKGSDLPVTARNPVTAFARRTDSAFMLVAVNPSRRPVEATLSCEGLPARLQVLSENRTVRATDGRISDRFEPYGVHVYTTTAPARRLATVAAVKEQVAAYKKQLADENRNNLAFAGNGGKVQASTYPRSIYLNDGTVDHIEWRESPRPDRPAWAEITLAKSHPVARVVVDATPFKDRYRLSDARILLRVAGQWQAVAQVEGNTDQTVFEFTFPAVTTDAVRVEITKPQSTVALTEIRVFGPSEK